MPVRASEPLREALRDAVCAVPADALVPLIVGAMFRTPRDELARLLSAALAEIGAGMPDPPLGGLRAEADWWAAVATEAELAAVAAAVLRRIDPRRFARAERRRLLVALWDSLPDDDKRAFLARVTGATRRAVAA